MKEFYYNIYVPVLIDENRRVKIQAENKEEADKIADSIVEKRETDGFDNVECTDLRWCEDSFEENLDRTWYAEFLFEDDE